jgi:hypothetical protein
LGRWEWEYKNIKGYGIELRLNFRVVLTLWFRECLEIGRELIRWLSVKMLCSDNSSAGRAEDCRVAWLSLGRWFNSSLSEFFIFHTLLFIL